MKATSKTFAQLDQLKGLPGLPPLPADGDEFPLPAWYRAVYYHPISELSVFDICRALMQEIHLEEIVPMAIAMIKEDLLAGDNSDGELLSALVKVPKTFWKQAISMRSELEKIIPVDQDKLPATVLEELEYSKRLKEAFLANLAKLRLNLAQSCEL